MQNFKKFIPFILTLLVLVIVLFVIFPQFADYDDAFETLKNLKSTDLLLILAFTVLNIFVYVLPFMVALPKLKYWPAFMIRQTAFLISNGIPGAGGPIAVGVQYAMLGEYGRKGTEATSSIIITGMWNILATASLPGLSVILVILAGESQDNNLLIGLLGILVAFLSLGGIILLFKNVSLAKKIASWIESLYGNFRRKFNKLPNLKLTNQLLDFREQTYKTMTSRLYQLAGVNYLQHISQFLVLYVTIDILQPGAISFVYALSAFAFARVGTFIPLTPGGLGTVDAILVALLVEGGVSNEVALAATLVWRASTYFPQIIIGLITFLAWRIKGGNKSETKN